MPKWFRFPNGYKCQAESKEEAIRKYHEHKVEADSSMLEERKESLFNYLGNVEDAIKHIKEEVDNSVKALDVVKRETFPKQVVKNYINEIKKYIDETDIESQTDNAWGTLRALTGSAPNWKAWVELCIEFMPSTASVADANKAKELLEELCQ